MVPRWVAGCWLVWCDQRGASPAVAGRLQAAQQAGDLPRGLAGAGRGRGPFCIGQRGPGGGRNDVSANSCLGCAPRCIYVGDCLVCTILLRGAEMKRVAVSQDDEGRSKLGYFDYRPGQHLALIEPTGGGKTRLKYQLLRAAMQQNPGLGVRVTCSAAATCSW